VRSWKSLPVPALPRPGLPPVHCFQNGQAFRFRIGGYGDRRHPNPLVSVKPSPSSSVSFEMDREKSSILESSLQLVSLQARIAT